MFSTGFTMNPSAIAETMQGETVLWMQSWRKPKRGYNRKRSNQRKVIIIIGCYLSFPSGEIQH
jgi:hypothetical protein